MVPDSLAPVALATLYGLIMGSAVTALAWRVPRGLSWARGRSACPACQALLGPLELVPVLSFLLARGRCRHCRARISARYPLTELMCAAWAVLLYLKVGPVWAFLPLSLWGFLLVALLWIDLEFKLLPDVLTLPGTGLGVAAALLALGWVPGALHALLGIAVGSGILCFLAWAWITFRKVEGMGMGDVKLAASSARCWAGRAGCSSVAAPPAACGAARSCCSAAGERAAFRRAPPPAPALVVFLWGQGWVARGGVAGALGRGPTRATPRSAPGAPRRPSPPV